MKSTLLARIVRSFESFGTRTVDRIDLTAPRHPAQLLSIGEVERRASAVEEPQPAGGRGARVAEHGADRRDAGATGDEEKAALRRRVREREAAERSAHAQQLTAAGQLEVVVLPPPALRVDPDEKLEVAV